MDDQQEPWLTSGLRQVLGAPARAFSEHVEANAQRDHALAQQQEADEQASRAARLQELRQMWQQIQQNGLFSLREQPVQTPER